LKKIRRGAQIVARTVRGLEVRPFEHVFAMETQAAAGVFQAVADQLEFEVSAKGIATRTSVPSPPSLSIDSVPPNSFTMAIATLRPRPSRTLGE
jgi:hypothetical protein